MNAEAKPLHDALSRRKMNLKRLCRAARVDYNHFSAVLAGKRGGKHTWRRMQSYLTDDEQAIVAATFGPVFGKKDGVENADADRRGTKTSPNT